MSFLDGKMLERRPQQVPGYFSVLFYPDYLSRNQFADVQACSTFGTPGQLSKFRGGDGFMCLQKFNRSFLPFVQQVRMIEKHVHRGSFEGNHEVLVLIMELWFLHAQIPTDTDHFRCARSPPFNLLDPE